MNPLTGLERHRALQAASWTALLPWVIGLCAYMVALGPYGLIPTNIGWLREGDPAQHYLGWAFFRQSPWTFPLGLNPSYGLEFSNAIVFSDSNPLMAFLHKPFAAWLPQPFQYFGAWLLGCMLLQAWFSWQLLGLVSPHPAIRGLGSILFVFSPPMLLRFHGHLSLGAHFLLVAALYLCMKPGLRRRQLAWGALLVVAALVHAYLLAMVGAFWIADIAGRWRRDELSVRRGGSEACLVLLAVGLACWQAGYFSVGRGVSSDGYGFYSMNLLALFDPNGWSYFMRDIPQGPGQYEGFNYLGLGGLLLIAAILPALLMGRLELRNAGRRFPFLVILLLGFTLFALSNKVGFAGWAVKLPMPEVLIKVFNVFRASGRIFWPVFYAILFFGIYGLIRSFTPRYAVAILGLAALAQVVDTSAGWRGLRSKMMAEPSSSWETPLKSAFWEEASSRSQKIRWVMPANSSPQWAELSYLAVSHGLQTDAVYLARVGTASMDLAQQKAASALQHGNFEKDSLYVLDERAVRLAAFTRDSARDFLTRVDGLYVLVPNGKQCSTCRFAGPEVQLNELLPEIPIGQTLATSAGGSGLNYLVKGWSGPESWGIWSDGPVATVEALAPSAEVRGVLLDVKPLLGRKHPKQELVVSANGLPIVRFTVKDAGGEQLKIRLPPEVNESMRKTGRLSIELGLPDAIRPADLGINGDSRRIGIGLKSLTFIP